MTALIRIMNHELRIMIFVLFMILASIFMIHPAFAQSPVPFGTGQTSTPSALPSSIPYTLTPIPSSVSPTSPLYTDLLVSNLFHSFSCLAVGQSVIGQPCLTYQMTKNAQGAIQGVPMLSSVNTSGGVLGTTTSLIGALYANPPVRTIDYLASVGHGLGIVKTANAQVVGSGAQVLNPIVKLWQVSRNISYVLMIIIFLIIGLMVMFRNKINPQTVITAQAALPGLVIGLIMITFSYFFAGLISDMAFVGTNVVGYYFVAAQGKLADSNFAPQLNLSQTMSNENSLSIFGKFTGIVEQGKIKEFGDTIWQYLDGGAQLVVTALAVFIAAQTTTQGTELLKAFPRVGEAIQAVLVGSSAAAAAISPSFMIGLAGSFVASLVLLYTMFKLLIRLINSYLTIIFLTFTAPFQFLAAALPGRQGIATGWILNMLGNILVFPAVLAVFYFVAFILGQNSGPLKVSINQRPDNTFISAAHAQGITSKPNMIVGKDTFPLFGGLDLSFIKILLAFGALVATPAIPDIIARTVGKASQAGQLIGQEIGGGVGQGQKYAGQFQQGAGAASGQLARARGLFPTPNYEAVVEDGKITGYRESQWSYQPGGLAKAGVGIRKSFSQAGSGRGGIATGPPKTS